MALLEIAHVSMSFSGLHALSDISFSVCEGQIIGLIGPNGAGKSTLLNCISRLYRPERGSMRFAGEDLMLRKAHEVAAMGIRRTFQNLELFREATVHENIVLGLVYRHRANIVSEFFDLPSARMRRAQANCEAGEIIEACGLRDIADIRVSELPYGLQKSVELARALAGRPRLLLLDEPSAGMNPEESRRVAQTIRRLRDANGISIILVEHDMRVVMAVCDYVVVLDHGEKIAEGTPGEVRRLPAVIKAYLGDEVDDA